MKRVGAVAVASGSVGEIDDVTNERRLGWAAACPFSVPTPSLVHYSSLDKKQQDVLSAITNKLDE